MGRASPLLVLLGALARLKATLPIVLALLSLGRARYQVAPGFARRVVLVGIDGIAPTLETAPTLHAVTEQARGAAHESSARGGAEIVVEHRQPRRGVYMPSRVDGERLRRALKGYRETHAADVLTGKETIVRDKWGGRGQAEKKLAFHRTVWTKFIEAGELGQSLPSGS